MDNQHHEPQPPVPSNVEGPALLPLIRHDGWTGEKMAIFCETLAETAIVAEACAAARMGISGAYAARRRSHVFAAAWDGALSIARERLADTLLARSMEGNVEQIFRDGELIGERHVLDNRLGLAIFRRLDRLTEMGMAVSTIGQRIPPTPARSERRRGAPGCNFGPMDWERAVEALRTGDDEGVGRALQLIKADEVEEVEGPPNPSNEGDDKVETIDLSDRCWWDEDGECWVTDFPPPDGFAGHQNRDYDDDNNDDEPSYERACTAEEAAILEADRAADRAIYREREAELRDAWFAYLSSEDDEDDDDEDSEPLPAGAGQGVGEEQAQDPNIGQQPGGDTTEA